MSWKKVITQDLVSDISAFDALLTMDGNGNTLPAAGSVAALGLIDGAGTCTGNSAHDNDETACQADISGGGSATAWTDGVSWGWITDLGNTVSSVNATLNTNILTVTVDGVGDTVDLSSLAGGTDFGASSFEEVYSSNTAGDMLSWNNNTEGWEVVNKESLGFQPVNETLSDIAAISLPNSNGTYAVTLNTTNNGTTVTGGRTALGDAAGKDVGTGNADVAAGSHTHTNVYQPLDSTLTDLAELTQTNSTSAEIVTMSTAADGAQTFDTSVLGTMAEADANDYQTAAAAADDAAATATVQTNLDAVSTTTATSFTINSGNADDIPAVKLLPSASIGTDNVNGLSVVNSADTLVNLEANDLHLTGNGEITWQGVAQVIGEIVELNSNDTTATFATETGKYGMKVNMAHEVTNNAIDSVEPILAWDGSTKKWSSTIVYEREGTSEFNGYDAPLSTVITANTAGFEGDGTADIGLVNIADPALVAADTNSENLLAAANVGTFFVANDTSVWIKTA